MNANRLKTPIPSMRKLDVTANPPRPHFSPSGSRPEHVGFAFVSVSGEVRLAITHLPSEGHALGFRDDAQAAALDSLIELYGRLPRTPSNAPVRDRACQRLRALGVTIAEEAEASDRRAEQLGVDRAIVALREAREALVRAADRLDREGVGSFEQDECGCAVDTIDNALAAMGVRS